MKGATPPSPYPPPHPHVTASASRRWAHTDPHTIESAGSICQLITAPEDMPHRMPERMIARKDVNGFA